MHRARARSSPQRRDLDSEGGSCLSEVWVKPHVGLEQVSRGPDAMMVLKLKVRRFASGARRIWVKSLGRTAKSMRLLPAGDASSHVQSMSFRHQPIA